jgi:cell division septation protein DedD
LFGILLALTTPAAFAKTAIDLMLEGRFGEAKAILDTSNVSPRYQLLYFAMIESEAARACSLYQVVALRYPNSDCDSVARLRLDQAQEAGFVLVPIAEWAQAAPGARPLALHREQPRVSEVEVRAPEAVEPPPLPVLVAMPPLPVPVSVEAQAPPTAEPEAPKEEPQVSVRDTLIAAERAPEPVKPVVVDVVAPPPPPVAHEIISTPVEAPPEPVVKETALPPTPIVEQPETPPPAATAVEKLTPAPTAAEKKTAEEPPPASVSLDHPVSNGHWYVQVGAFANFDNAHRLALSLQNAGYPVKLVPRDSAKGKLLQVRVGGYAARAELAPIAEQLKEKFRVPTILISE